MMPQSDKEIREKIAQAAINTGRGSAEATALHFPPPWTEAQCFAFFDLLSGQLDETIDNWEIAVPEGLKEEIKAIALAAFDERLCELETIMPAVRKGGGRA